MRVVGGEQKGHTLRAPRGMETRPTSDKVREALFAILTGRFEGEPVLDLFAGTGALGIEALSRGASEATFVERRREACQVIRQNLAHTKLAHRAHVHCLPIARALPALEGAFELILLDPPYALPGLHDIMAMVGGAGVLRDQSVVVLEHTPRFAVFEQYGRLELQRQKVYGDTAISLFVVRSGGAQ